MKTRLKKLVKDGLQRVDRRIDDVEAVLPVAIPFRLFPLASSVADPGNWRRAIGPWLPGVVHAGRRGSIRKVRFDGVERMEKTFLDDADGAASFENEVLAQELFSWAPWKLPITVVEPRRLQMPRLPDDARLDRSVERMGEAERRRVATDALDAALDIHTAGYAHRDFSARNLYFHDGAVLVSDFETLYAYPPGERPPFPESYDVTGQGLPSPFKTKNMGYSASRTATLESILEVPAAEALDLLRDRLKDELRASCRTFHTEHGRHVLREPRIYCAFETPSLVVRPDEAQRDAKARLKRFGLGPSELEGKSVLDLGCNTGAMLFQATQLGIERGLGLEYDEDKVVVARRIAAFSGLNELEFRQADIDETEAEAVGGPFDVVFCLAIEAHVKSPSHLYELLAAVTKGVLCFEGNSSTEPAQVESSLRSVGFSEVISLGVCDDDRRAENNRRPLFLARR